MILKTYRKDGEFTLFISKGKLFFSKTKEIDKKIRVTVTLFSWDDTIIEPETSINIQVYDENEWVTTQKNVVAKERDILIQPKDIKLKENRPVRILIDEDIIAEF